MKNIPRIYLEQEITPGDVVSLDKAMLHYLQRVMRTNSCLVFNNGIEYTADIKEKQLHIGASTDHADPVTNIGFYFSPIKRLDEMLNMATQMGVSDFYPVIMDRTTEKYPKWARMERVIIEAAEQSNRNSLPKLHEPVKFKDLEKKGLVYGDERAAYFDIESVKVTKTPRGVIIGPEGGFSEQEFKDLEKSGAFSIGLGKTILRAETAAVAILAKVIK